MRPAGPAGSASGCLRPGLGSSSLSRSWQTVPVDDEELLSEAEQALTEIKVAQGLSERHASVLAALRIRLKGSPGASLEDLLVAADEDRTGELEAKLAESERRTKPSLDNLLKK